MSADIGVSACDRPGCKEPRESLNHQPCSGDGEHCAGVCEAQYGVPCHSWPTAVDIGDGLCHNYDTTEGFNGRGCRRPKGHTGNCGDE